MRLPPIPNMCNKHQPNEGDNDEKKSQMVLAIFSLLFPGFSLALECNALLDHGLHNIRISQGSAATTKFLYTNHCYKKFDKLSDSQLTEAEAEVFGYGGGSAGYSRDKREERLLSWCKASKEEAESSSARHNESRLIYDKALQAYTSCNKLAANSIRASIQIAADQTRANVNLRYVGGAISGVQFLGANHEQNFTCTTTGPRINGDGVIDYSDDFLENNNIFIKAQSIVVNCVRSPATEEKEIDGVKYQVLPKATIGIDTAQESFLLDFPESWPSPGAPVAQYDALKKELLAKLAEEKASIIAEIGKTNDSVQATNKLINQKANEAANNLAAFRNSLNVKVYKVMRGEHHRYAHPNWVHVGCGDPDAWLRSQCPNQTITINQVYQRSGDHCGYTYYIAACITK